MKKELIKDYKAMAEKSPRNMETAVKKYLEDLAAASPEFAAKYSADRFEDCIKFIFNCAAEILDKMHGEVADEVCYKMARDYFEDEIWREEKETPKAAKKEPPKEPEPVPAVDVVPEKKLIKPEPVPEQLDLFGGLQ